MAVMHFLEKLETRSIILLLYYRCEVLIFMQLAGCLDETEKKVMNVRDISEDLVTVLKRGRERGIAKI